MRSSSLYGQLANAAIEAGVPPLLEARTRRPVPGYGPKEGRGQTRHLDRKRKDKLGLIPRHGVLKGRAAMRAAITQPGLPLKSDLP